ncbi:hypothetical protein KX928_21835 [Roseobacter sp. YSTF-M11]|uniref:Uncharacterized protein n=1 Tax=Roseobacter insulae TaxID=2859783 RepID=A0A9X1G0J1_9RHOB|nr:hypothetical protein [Roseobacter insulae]MBW4710440.1 hypothetical protein [Roseobacter insulae]
MSDMSNLPAGVQDYLISEDALRRAQLLQDHPQLAEELKSPEVREIILAWLASDPARQASNESLLENCIEFLTAGAAPGEAAVIRPFSLHGNQHVRLRSYEFLVSLYFPDRNREALMSVLQLMLSDHSETVRREAAGFVQRANLSGEMTPFLRVWRDRAEEDGRGAEESFELINRLLTP